jgi:hypothetical protein
VPAATFTLSMRFGHRFCIRGALTPGPVSRGARHRWIPGRTFGELLRLDRADLCRDALAIRCQRNGAPIGSYRLHRTIRAFQSIAESDKKRRIMGLPANRVVASVKIRVSAAALRVTAGCCCRGCPRIGRYRLPRPHGRGQQQEHRNHGYCPDSCMPHDANTRQGAMSRISRMPTLLVR